VISLIKKKIALRSLRERLLAAAILLSLAAGLFLLPTLWLYIDWLAQKRTDQFGELLINQLAQNARQPTSRNDIISLQVLVDDTVAGSEVTAYAAILDAESNLTAQSGNKPAGRNEPDGTYHQAIILENSIAGYVLINLDTDRINNSLYGLFWAVAGFWLVFSVVLGCIQMITGARISQRLMHVVTRLPTYSSPDSTERDEMGLLEHHIEPLLVKAPADPASADDLTSVTLTIRFENIERLQAHLSQKNFSRLLRNFDTICGRAVKLYDAVRLMGSKNCVHLQFSCSGEPQNALLRALCCFTAISTLAREYDIQSGAQLIFCGALGETSTRRAERVILHDLDHERSLEKLTKITTLADFWQVLVEAKLIAKLPEDTLQFRPLENASDLILFQSFGSQLTAKFSGQLTYLRNQLQDLESADLTSAAS
jgi:uncharacterized membrane protein affecting hemolysin expression